MFQHDMLPDFRAELLSILTGTEAAREAPCHGYANCCPCRHLKYRREKGCCPLEKEDG